MSRAMRPVEDLRREPYAEVHPLQRVINAGASVVSETAPVLGCFAGLFGLFGFIHPAAVATTASLTSGAEQLAYIADNTPAQQDLLSDLLWTEASLDGYPLGPVRTFLQQSRAVNQQRREREAAVRGVQRARPRPR